ncbi:uncharacterized protein [Tursiops truncatus]|uniref:uncharacterized protein n=1 Tax=Tursiops truncatus TaxID=9739 RepID=UPI003CCF89C3
MDALGSQAPGLRLALNSIGLQFSDLQPIKVGGRAAANDQDIDSNESRKKNEIMPFAATWMQLEIITLTELFNYYANIEDCGYLTCWPTTTRQLGCNRTTLGNRLSHTLHCYLTLALPSLTLQGQKTTPISKTGNHPCFESLEVPSPLGRFSRPRYRVDTHSHSEYALRWKHPSSCWMGCCLMELSPNLLIKPIRSSNLLN